MENTSSCGLKRPIKTIGLSMHILLDSAIVNRVGYSN